MCEATVRSLILERYSTAYGAVPAVDYPAYLIAGDYQTPCAVLGIRPAANGPIFLERYLDRPVETVLSERLGRVISRDRIVELGDHASDRASATISLWHDAAVALSGQADIAVAVLTRSLRLMFDRLGFDLLQLAPARIESLGAVGAEWGRYYKSDPILCAGDITACRTAIQARTRA